MTDLTKEQEKLLAEVNWKVMEVITKRLDITITEYLKNKNVGSFIAAAIQVLIVENK
ncbi:MAG: hypothetical protein OEX81_05870 [Candidatus Pacebacteria bacterium]|nr:hypothetical protein [Candidatus Paceibacterota bacterium]